MASENRRFVQFPHPGGEHSPDYGDRKDWNPIRLPNGRANPHRRKFLELEGAWVCHSESDETHEGMLWAWGEWEPESRVLRCFDSPKTGAPRYLWQPTWQPKDNFRKLHNTDPFIFDGFYYGNCKQDSLAGLRQLGRGSVIVFGSMKKSDWVVDTVFVVRDYLDHTDKNYETILEGNVPRSLWNATLATYRGSESGWTRRMYRGATHDEPVNGMFSFFPCLLAEATTPFARPRIELPEKYFNPKLSQGAKGCAVNAGPLAESTVRDLWSSIARQVVSQELLLGTWASLHGVAG